MRRWLPLCALVLTSALAMPALAHLGSMKFVYAERTSEGVSVRVAIEAVDASMQLGLGEEPDVEALLGRSAELGRWLAEGITVRDSTRECPSTPGPVTATRRDERDFVEVLLTYECPDADAASLTLRDDTIFDDDRQHEAAVRVAWSGEQSSAILRTGSREARLGPAPGLGTLVAIFVVEGALHFATGYDHVLFLLSLVLAAGFVARDQGFARALRDVAILVSAFTLGHSVTLIAAALEVVVLPSGPVEAAIAASIVIVAALNVWRPEERGPMPWLAAGFGLIHGFGFSSVLAELGLPREHTVAALLSFNVGIEVAQLAFVAAVLGPIAWAARTKGYRDVVVRGGSLVIGLLAAIWLVDRL